MRLRPFTPNAPITDIADDPSQHFEDPDALVEQDMFDSRLPTPITEQPQQAIPDQSESEKLQADHGIIYYEIQHIESDRQRIIPESQVETREVHPDSISIIDPEPVNDEYTPTERPSVPSRNTKPRYGLRHNPQPTTYPDFLVHELHGTPALQQLLLKNKNL